jgi:hypothetical protein
MRTTRRGFLGALLAAPLAAAAAKLKAGKPGIGDDYVGYFPEYALVPTMPLYSCPVIPLDAFKDRKALAAKWYHIEDDGRLTELDKEWQHTVAQIGSGLAVPPEAFHGGDLAGGYRPYKTDMVARMARDFGRPLARQRFPRDILDKIVKVEPL